MTKRKAKVTTKSGNANLTVSGAKAVTLAYSCVRQSAGGRAVLVPVDLADEDGKKWIEFDVGGHKVSIPGELYADSGTESLDLQFHITNFVSDSEADADEPVASGNDKLELYLLLKADGMSKAQIVKAMSA